MQGEELLRDLLAIQVIVELNVAFCERHLLNCPPSPQLQQECAYVSRRPFLYTVGAITAGFVSCFCLLCLRCYALFLSQCGVCLRAYQPICLALLLRTLNVTTVGFHVGCVVGLQPMWVTIHFACCASTSCEAGLRQRTDTGLGQP